MEFTHLQEKAREVRAKYALLEKRRGKEWSREDIVRGFIGDVGDLAKLTMAEDGLRSIENSSVKLSHELADCLWSLVIISDLYGINLEEAFVKTMNELGQRVDSDLKG